ncbi:Arginine transport system permease protein ArtQ [bioreactor metagenome]|uniref:Arginine transport system permease protein ArtQ n=1 Tax=bioreactor metagenome TaxID=1076179 RepID=A0A644XG06_9ZZZZ
MDLAQWYGQMGQRLVEGHSLGFWNGALYDFYQSFLYGDRWKLYIQGLGVTLEATVLALLMGVVIGVAIAVIRSVHDQQRLAHRNPVLGFFDAVCKVYVTVIRGTPMMVQLLIMGFVVFKSSRNITLVAALSFSINSGAYTSEIIRGGLMSVDPGQMEAGRSLGMNYRQVMRFIVVPQAIKNILPALGNEFITLLKDTSIVTVIGGRDITKVALLIQGKTYGGFMSLFGVALVYLAMVMLFTWLLDILERRMRKSDQR